MNVLEQAQQKIIEAGDPEYIRLFALLGVGDIDLLQKAIIKCDDVLEIIRFAKEVKGASVRLLQAAVIRTGKVGAIAGFGVGVKGANKKLILRKLLEQEKPPILYIYRLVKAIQEENTKKDL